MTENPLAQSSEDLMIVYVAGSEPEAYIVVGRLENEGIAAFVSQEPAGRAYGISIGEMGNVKVVVRADDYDAAKAILDEDVEEDDDDEDYDDDDDDDLLDPYGEADDDDDDYDDDDDDDYDDDDDE